MVDGSRFHEFKARYGTTLVTGIAKIQGFKVIQREEEGGDGFGLCHS